VTAWSDGAAGWVEHWAGFSAPARAVVAEAAAIGCGSRVLDVGCGSGELCELAALRGASVSGIDAAAELVEVARRRVPAADLRVGAIEQLPWADQSFDVVTGVNAFQFAANYVGALVEARRVTRTGGRVAICNWDSAEHRQLDAILGPLYGFARPQPFDPPPVGEPGVLEDLARHAGLAPEQAGELSVPYAFADAATLERALWAFVPIYSIAPKRAEGAVAATVEAARPFRRPDGSYVFVNAFRYLIAVAE
jgi:SAM-dependent methyltransferase